MSLLRLLRGVLPVLLVLPLLTTPLQQALRGHSRGATAARMACCSVERDACGHCEQAGPGAACGVKAASSGDDSGCSISGMPCRRGTPSIATAFQWTPFLVATATPASCAGTHSTHPTARPQAPVSRVTPTPERPPAA